MAKMKVTMSGEGFAKNNTVWNVPEELVKPYSVFLQAWMAKGFLEASIAVAEAVGDNNVAGMSLLERSK
jgi:hypothetical protein